MEPRFSLPPNTPLSSKKELVIGGVRVYVYGLEELKCSVDDNIAILYLAHNRTRTYKVTEGVAHEVLHRYQTDGKQKKAQLIAVTMNMRNHGDREISPQANRTWADGNENHGLDLLSMIEGSAQDFKLIMDFIPAYLPQCACIYNIMGGISLGGHTAWRIASLAPGRLHGFAMVVGSPNLASLLLSRLNIQTDISDIDSLEYKELYELMNPQQRRMWPNTLDKLVRDGDRVVTESFPTDVPLLLCNGKYDTLVPAKYTEEWVARRKQSRNIKLFVQDNTGHSCTKEMVGMLAIWLSDMFCQDASARL
ncbi:uncharacterized protein BHQ10_003561 [Talaromyces amestolkiae]|uniref:AB hydrolase-1 domain-containing protein n=1 Tax=Talaromyces amestolkiae TaxID=1196081 RepID=A0A364KVI9_TALAM|nr:uncharacterized protein BHQ10_003561 [Talaromyces amestolkiae]RAO67549.1 hypothetical protein BHQ10_003561 [Talaromyces amestolkiae]